MTEPTLLDECAISKIEARIAKRDDTSALESACGEYNCSCHYDIPALCATVKHLRAENQKLMASRRVHELDNHHNALACGYCSGPLKDELTRLAQVEQERDALRQEVEGLRYQRMFTDSHVGDD